MICRTASCVIELISFPRQPLHFPSVFLFFLFLLDRKQEADRGPPESSGSHLASRLLSIHHEYGAAAPVLTLRVIDIQHISYRVSGICARAAHLLMNIKAGGGRQTEQGGREGGRDIRELVVVESKIQEVFTVHESMTAHLGCLAHRDDSTPTARTGAFAELLPSQPAAETLLFVPL